MKRYVAQGKNLGITVAEQMTLQQPPGLLAIHTNMPATAPDEIAKILPGGSELPARLPTRSMPGISSWISPPMVSVMRMR